MSTRIDRFKNEMAAGGSVKENEPDEQPSRLTAVLGIGAWIVLFVVLAVISPWMLVFVVGVLISIFLHEVGHFVTARRSGMKVTQFFMGFGPRIWSTHRDGVEYGVRAIPLGAFVRIIGMNNLDEVPPEDEAFTYRQASYPKRMLVITAGSLMHLIIAVVTIVGVYTFAGRVEETGQVKVFSVVENSPAAQAGLEPGDVVLSVDGTAVTNSAQFRTTLSSTAPGTTVALQVLRDGTTFETDATLVQSPAAAAGEQRGFLGVGSDSRDRVDQSVGQALVKGPQDLVQGVGQAVVGIAKVLNPVNVFGHLTGTNTDETSRPTTLVGATRISDDFGQNDGWAGILSLLAALNVSVAVFNMFPLLPLDGGHAAIATYERLRERNGKRYFADVSKLMPVVTITVALLAFMFLTGLYLDTMKGF
ncbi:MAG: M50 family metallopeptidase [Ilumatobacteraceae bacterium]